MNIDRFGTTIAIFIVFIFFILFQKINYSYNQTLGDSPENKGENKTELLENKKENKKEYDIFKTLSELNIVKGSS